MRPRRGHGAPEEVPPLRWHASQTQGLPPMQAVQAHGDVEVVARKKRGGRRGGMLVKARGFVRTGVNLTFKVVGAIVALSPTYRGLKNMAGGNIEAGAADILYDTT